MDYTESVYEGALALPVLATVDHHSKAIETDKIVPGAYYLDNVYYRNPEPAYLIATAGVHIGEGAFPGHGRDVQPGPRRGRLRSARV
jgi:hypothetical protein